MLNARTWSGGAGGRSRARRPAGPGPAAPSESYPYEYAATFRIEGRQGNIVQASIAVSVDAAFVALGISYGFEEDRGRRLVPNVVIGSDPTFSPATTTLEAIPVHALIEGVRLNPDLIPVLLPEAQGTGPQPDPTLTTQLAASSADRFLQRVKQPEQLAFLFSMVDTASGRELQDQPTLGLASLGSADGKRPFRPLAKPLTFLPRSTLRLQVVERSSDVKGTLFIVLHGYKRPDRGGIVQPIVVPPAGARVVPFDYVSSVELSGRSGNVLNDEIPINVEGRFFVTSVGYGLQLPTNRVRLIRSLLGAGPPYNLNAIPLRAFPPHVLQGGIRIKPNMIRLAVNVDGHLSDDVSDPLLDELFEPLNRIEDVSFRYSFFNSGTGRDLQNLPIHNIAGLGNANGDRPFKVLPFPLELLPRSALRVTIEERFGLGRLFIAFQGYKVLDNAAPAAVRTQRRRP